MNKEFIPYEQALELKELGFDEPCLAFYPLYDIQENRERPIKPIKEGSLVMVSQANVFWGETYYTNDINTTDTSHFYQVAAPLYQQAFRWFRYNYNIHCSIGIHNHSVITRDVGQPTESTFVLDSPTYEQAELDSLNKMIDIVNSRK